MVYFVGAGPGAVDLITVRGANLLREADLIIYAGSLVNERLLDTAKEGCRIMNSAEMTLEQVIGVMTEAAAETAEEGSNKSIVRLHTGDPCLYGAVREQMDELDKLGIGYEVVPGVSSFCAAAAALKAEYTLPGVSQSVIITRMEGRTAVPAKEDIELFAAHGATMILFLSAGLLQEATAKLIAGGYKAETPAAIVYKASWPDEKVFRTTISGLHETAQENNITKTALILIGHFLGDGYERSKLYDPSFSHEFRQAGGN
jgi:precorrin-4/cobalt-precorrin-4 C11-methyltransferase